MKPNARGRHVRRTRTPHGRHGGTERRSINWSRALVLLLAGVAATYFLTANSRSGPLDAREPRDVDPFTSGAVWNEPIPADAPVDPRSDQIIEFLRRTNARRGCVLLAGAGDDPWGAPVYWVEEGDPSYQVTSDRYPLPPEFDSLRIPVGAEPGRNSDSEMVVYDVDRGFVAHLSKARFHEEDETWSAGGGSIAYLDSNGLDSRLSEADEARNTGTFRGYNGLIAVIRYDEVADRTLDRTLKVGVAESSGDSIWPMAGSDGDSTDPDAPPQGTRIRIRPDVDLDGFDLDPEALEIARALQTHGAMIADSTGGGITLLLEDTILTSGTQRWDVGRTGLCDIPITDFVVVDRSYR
jgi:hypothetical protein